MASKKQPKNFEQIQEFLIEGIFVKSKVLRRLIDKDKSIVQITQLDEALDEEFNKFKTAIEKAVKEEGRDSQKRIKIGEGTFQIRTASRLLDTINAGEKGVKSAGVERGFANFRQQNQFFTKAFPALVKNKQLGHQNISVIRGLLSTALATKDGGKDLFPSSDPNRKRILALLAIVKEIDAVNKKGVNLLDLVDNVRIAASRKRSFKAVWKKDVSILQGLSERIELEYEEAGLNQEKGTMASIIGGYFKEIVEGETKNVDAFLASVEYENLRGSPTLVEDILDLSADTIDPKKQFKSRKLRGSKKSTSKGTRVRKARRAKLTAPVIPQRTRSNTQQRRDLSPLALAALINNKLPDVVAKNMVPPRLQLRTGRLAQSARVIDIQSTSQGFPSIGYTYEKDPYQVFESSSGTRFSDRQRDPRNLIDASVREIAATLFTGRLFTRRI